LHSPCFPHMCLRAPFLVTRKSLAHILRFSLSIAVLQVEYIPCTWVLLQSFSHTLFHCRDSSLYGHVQTISQDLILDLLKRGDLCDFRVFTYITCFTFSHVSCFHASHIFCISDFSHFHASHILCTFCNPTQFVFCALAYLVGFTFPRISHFVFLHSRIFALWHVLPHASLGSITFCSHVLFLSSKVHWCIFHFVSLALYHICLCIPIYVHLSHYVFILHHPCMFSATYSAPRPGNLLSMLIRQRIVGGFWGTSLPSLTH
jgi:hypothetical protein